MKNLILVIISVLLMSGINSTGQKITVTGTVIDENGQPLPGVNIIEKGTSNGTVSDINGKFSMAVNEKATLVFNFIGYESEEVKVEGKTVINVQLLPAVAALEEVVVVGYAAMKKSELTGCVTSVSSSNGLFGRFAGRSMQKSAAPANFNGYNYDFNTEGYSAINESGFKDVSVNPLSTFSIDVDVASYANIRRFLNMGQ